MEAVDVLFVSAHPWDVAGAANVGMQTAFIEQPGEMLYPLAPTPTFKATNLEELSHSLFDMFAVNKKPL